MAVLGLVVVWSATCAFGLSATVNTDCGKRVLSLSADTSRCAGAHGHDRMNRDRRPPPGSGEERGLAMKLRLTFVASYKSIFQKQRTSASSTAPKSCSPWGSLSSVK